MSEKAKKVKVPEDTPLIRQFFEVKAQQPDAMLLYRVGDFYETYGADAVEASKVLGLVLTGKSNGDKGRIEMAGFPGLWLQLTPGDGTDLSKQDVGQLKADIQALGIDAIACYNMGGFTPDYAQQCANSVAIREQVDSLYDIPIFPTVSIGWDDSPRFPRKGADDITHINHSPEVFEQYLQIAKEYADAHAGSQPKMVMVNAWNEWVEGSYLLPDEVWGFRWLEAVKHVFKD